MPAKHLNLMWKQRYLEINMKILCLAILALLSISCCSAQVVRKIKIKHADPELIKRLLAGNQRPLPPEISVIINTLRFH
jgi:hypothetical protein